VLEIAAALVKALLYGSLLTAAGTPLALVLLRPSAALADHTVRVMRLAAIAVIALSVLAAVILFIRLGGAFDQPTLHAVFSSGPAAALALQTAGAALLLTPVDDDAPGHAWRITGVLTMMASVVFNGHAAAMSPPTGMLAMIHATAASWWVGSLWILHQACRDTDRTDLVRLVLRFSSLAVFVVAGLVVAGIALILALVPFDTSPWLTNYVVTLMLKLVFVAAVLALAAYNKYQLTQRLPQEAERLRRSIAVELGAIACVLTTTAVLTTYFSPDS
jgi:putative copper export protein